MSDRCCRKCGISKPETEFSRHPHGPGGLQWRCKQCLSELKKAAYAADPEKYRERARAVRYKSRYGITLEEFEAMVEAQGGRCAICRRKQPRGRRLCVDHCHKTGRVRGLLCNRCNTTLPRWRDDSDLFRRAAEYLDGR